MSMRQTTVKQFHVNLVGLRVVWRPFSTVNSGGWPQAHTKNIFGKKII